MDQNKPKKKRLNLPTRKKKAYEFQIDAEIEHLMGV